MQLVVDVTDKSAGGRLAQADLQRLKQVATEDPHPDHQRLMQALLQAVAAGKPGLSAARQTAARLVEMYFLFSRERYLGLKMYEARLRRSRLVDGRDE
jgi:LmbE family N-acetylglucosaminyl deacetylase